MRDPSMTFVACLMCHKTCARSAFPRHLMLAHGYSHYRSWLDRFGIVKGKYHPIGVRWPCDFCGARHMVQENYSGPKTQHTDCGDLRVYSSMGLRMGVRT